jgi:hypothetical protein
VDRRKNPISLPGHDGPIDANTAPVAVDACRRADPDDEIVARDPLESQIIVFCGDQRQVNEGFAIALRVMGLDAGFLRDDIPLTVTNSNRETTK